jgi:undecaprenyl diphosphate synthase
LGLFEHLLRRELAELCQEGVRLRYLGDLSLLPKSLQAIIQESVLATATNPGVRLTVALNYGSRQEIARVCRQVAEQVQQGELSLEQIDEQFFGQCLDTVDVGDPDLLIRTSGEMRLSNFLLWQMAYTEIYFTETLWPDFDRRTFEKALVVYQGRDRRFGKVSA